MLLPVDAHLWHAQALVMLTPRKPLFVLCVSNSSMYWPTVAAARVFHHGFKSPLAEASLAGLLAGIFYTPYDVCGARFLWWTWHDSDPGVAIRSLGVPAGSTAWSMTFTFCFCLLWRAGCDLAWSGPSSLALACATTPLMLFLLKVCALIGVESMGGPGNWTVDAAAAAFGLLVLLRPAAWIVPFPSPQGPKKQDFLPMPEPLLFRWAVTLYFLTLAMLAAFTSPEKQISTGVHQEFGPCNVTDVDLLGHDRNMYICRERFPDFYFDFHCPPAAKGAKGRWAHIQPQASLSKAGSTIAWYTICGRLHPHFERWMSAVAVLCAAGIAWFWWCLAAGVVYSDLPTSSMQLQASSSVASSGAASAAAADPTARQQSSPSMTATASCNEPQNLPDAVASPAGVTKRRLSRKTTPTPPRQAERDRQGS
ncbi:unnamed protein product [Polarella glacialis]|uniref:DUF7802 domain-containing protein n=1 Tax=Polarella glacialis TaxID=89957 RepID=A0A813DDK2_POLGL|nr:unnamed protein product [Polarella glacialis]